MRGSRFENGTAVVLSRAVAASAADSPSYAPPMAAPRATAPPPAEMPPPGSTPRTPPAPPPASAGPRVWYKQKYIPLLDWWLERVEGEEGKIRIVGSTPPDQMRKGAPSSKRNSTGPARVLRSAPIVKRHDYNDIETEEGYLIRMGRTLDRPRTRENGFDDKVCDWFEFGFPVQWEELVNPVMEPENDHAQSTSQSTADHSVEYYMKLFTSKEFLSNPMNYACITIGSYSSSGCGSNTNGPTFQRPESSATRMAASLGLRGGTMDMPEEPLATPGVTCSSGQLSDQHESIRVDTSEEEIVNQSIRSVPLGQSTGSVCTNSKVDGNISASSKVVPVDKEDCRSRLGAVSSPSINETLKCGKTSGSLEISPTKGMPSQSGAVEALEDNSVRRLRSGKVFGIPSIASVKTGQKRKRVQHEASNKKMVRNEGATPAADLTHNENGSSAAGTIAEDKNQSHDPQRKGSGRPAKRRDNTKSPKKRDNAKSAKRRREVGKLFSNFM